MFVFPAEGQPGGTPRPEWRSRGLRQTGGQGGRALTHSLISNAREDLDSGHQRRGGHRPSAVLLAAAGLGGICKAWRTGCLLGSSFPSIGGSETPAPVLLSALPQTSYGHVCLNVCIWSILVIF